MSYLVLARKYRPRNFAEIVGQGHVVQALSNALESQRLHHAYFFTGTRGVGKTTVSRILAKSLNCQGVDGNGGITANPCGVCQACTDIDAGRFVDYTELDAASNRGVDEVQALLEQAVYKPVQGRFKVFMIDEVHMLSSHAFNAMLKTLEEPPEYLKFVLATTDPQKVPVTVLSRCLQFNLRPMAAQTILEHLRRVLDTEQVTAQDQALRLIARAARGSMRDALSLTDQAIAFGSGQLQEATVRQMLGSVDRSYVFKLLEALAAGDGTTVVQVVETLRLNGLSAASTLEEMVTVLQRMAVVQVTGQTQRNQASDPASDQAQSDDSQTDELTDPDAADTAQLAAALPADETQLLYSICLHGRADLGLAPDEYAALTMVLLRLLAFKPEAEKKTLAISENRLTPPAVAARAVGVSAATATATAPAPVPVPVPVQPWEDVPAPASRSTAPQGQPPATADSPTSAKPPSAAAVQGQRLPVRSAGVVPSTAAANSSMGGSDTAGDTHKASAADSASSALHSTANDHANAPAANQVIAVPVRQQVLGRIDTPSAESSPGFTPSAEGDFWHTTVQGLVSTEAIGAMVRELALQSQLVARDTDQWLLRVERESLNQLASRERLSAALRAAGFAVTLAVEVGRVTDSPNLRNAMASAQMQLAAEKIILENPFVQTMVREFGAKIVPGSIKAL